MTNYYYVLDMLKYRKPYVPFEYIQLASNFHKAMLIGWEWPVQIVLINFGTQVLLRSIALRSLTVEGFMPMLEFGDLIFKLF